MEIRRFGIGHRRKDGPPGTHGVEGTPLHADPRGVVAELALKANAAIAPHSNPNLAYLVVIEGGGFVQVGDERARVSAGDAVVWPPDVIHAAWTELTPMRAIVVEFAPETGQGQMIELEAAAIAGNRTGGAVEIDPGDGELTSDQPVMPANRVSPEQEPW